MQTRTSELADSSFSFPCIPRRPTIAPRRSPVRVRLAPSPNQAVYRISAEAREGGLAAAWQPLGPDRPFRRLRWRQYGAWPVRPVPGSIETRRSSVMLSKSAPRRCATPCPRRSVRRSRTRSGCLPRCSPESRSGERRSGAALAVRLAAEDGRRAVQPAVRYSEMGGEARLHGPPFMRLRLRIAGFYELGSKKPPSGTSMLRVTAARRLPPRAERTSGS
jgi:hypothetical protein